VKIPLCRVLHRRLPLPARSQCPKCPLNQVVLEWLNDLDDPLDGRGWQRDGVWVADVFPVRHHLESVAGQQRTMSTGPACPMQDRAVEMAARPDQGQAVPQRASLAFLKYDGLVGAQDQQETNKPESMLSRRREKPSVS